MIAAFMQEHTEDLLPSHDLPHELDLHPCQPLQSRLLGLNLHLVTRPEAPYNSLLMPDPGATIWFWDSEPGLLHVLKREARRSFLRTYVLYNNGNVSSVRLHSFL